MVSNPPLVSIVMPVFDALPWLAEAVESIVNQSYRNIEFVIVDDRSSDGSVELLQKFAAQDARIKLILHSSNLGVPAALNQGIAQCSGKYIARMDADDISSSQRIGLQVDHMERNPSCGVVGSWIYRLRQKGDERMKTFPEMNDDLKLLLMFECCFSHPTVMMRRFFLDRLSFVYDENFRSAQDYELWSRLRDHCDFYCLQQPLLWYREHEMSVSKQAKRVNLKRERVDKIYQFLFDSSKLSGACSLKLHKQIVHRENRSQLKPSDVRAHLACVFVAYPTAKNKDSIRQQISRQLCKNPLFWFRCRSERLFSRRQSVSDKI